jgi:hypothetical protein
MFTIVTGRYNNETWEASVKYRMKKKFECIYAPPYKLAETIDVNSPVFVIEMNNSTNQIMGIGFIKNKLVTDKVYKVQEDSNCNRYIYIGKYHISREVLNEYNPFLVYVLDEILFKGYTHSKRGSGLTKIPEKVLKLDVCEGINIKKEIKDVFIYHFKDKLLSKNENKQLKIGE